MRRLTTLFGAALLLIYAQGLGRAAPRVAPGVATPGASSPSAPLTRSIPVTLDSAEPVERISVRYYGSAADARAILLVNGLPAWGRRLPSLAAGKPLRLPTSWSYRVRPGDTWAQLALDYLGDASKGAFLARLNGKPVTDGAPHGHVIVVPAVIGIPAPRTLGVEKMASLLLALPEKDSRVAAQAEWIRDFNDLKRGVPRALKVLRVPMPGLRLLGWYVPTALPVGDPGVRRRVERLLEETRADLRAGRYLHALDRLGRFMDVAALAETERAELHLARCTALVALGRPELALEDARQALAARPGWVLDPVRISPKVRAVFEEARKAHGKPSEPSDPSRPKRAN